jgi:hypothetical protein
VVGWYGGSEEYALISGVRSSRETFRKQRLQAPISVTPEHHRKADRQMLVDATSPSHSATLSRIPVDEPLFHLGDRSIRSTGTAFETLSEWLTMQELSRFALLYRVFSRSTGPVPIDS